MVITKNDYLFNPWEKQFLDHVKSVNYSIDLICPFIKLPIIKKILVNLPENKDIRIRILSRFTKQVFIQGSSDLSVFDLLLNYAASRFNVTAHNLSNLHAKIYVFDGKEMFLTSSNLSYSGLNKNFEIAVKINDERDVREVNKYISSKFLEDTVITNEDVQNMTNSLNMRTSQLIELDQIEELGFDAPDEEIPDLQESIFSDYVEQTDETNIHESKSKFTRLEEINNFIIQRGVAEYNQINGISFESTNRPKINKEEMTEEVLQEFKDYWLDKASSDQNLIENHVRKLFGNIVEDDKKLKNLNLAFIHQSWINEYKEESWNDREIYNILGKQVHMLLITKSLVEKNLFAENKIGDYSINSHYILEFYPYGEILSTISCHFILHFGDISKKIDREIFHIILGVLVISLSFDKFYNLYKKLFDRVEDFAYDNYAGFDYKTTLQEMTQSDFGSPIYKLISKSGLEHKSIFEYAVFLGEDELGRGIGNTKKEATKEAAYQGLKNLYDREYFNPNEYNKQRYFKTYAISDDRIKSLRSLNRKLPISINNIRLLDIALTHTSYINSNRASRSNLKLALYGANLELFIRTLIYFKKMEGLKTKSAMNNISNLLGISLVQIFPVWFDNMELQDYLNRVISMKKIPNQVKIDTVQAIIAVIFMELGIDKTVEFGNIIWTNIIDTELTEIEVHPVTRVQSILGSIFKEQVKKHLIYEVVRESRLPENRVEYEVVCLIEGKEYGRGIDSKKAFAKANAAGNVLKNHAFQKKYVQKSS